MTDVSNLPTAAAPKRFVGFFYTTKPTVASMDRVTHFMSKRPRLARTSDLTTEEDAAFAVLDAAMSAAATESSHEFYERPMTGEDSLNGGTPSRCEEDIDGDIDLVDDYGEEPDDLVDIFASPSSYSIDTYAERVRREQDREKYAHRRGAEAQLWDRYRFRACCVGSSAFCS